MKKCPYCAEEIQDEAGICKWCHSDVTVSPQALGAATSGKATASLIFGIFFPFLPAAALAIFLGHRSRNEIKRSGGRLVGARRALAGLTLGYAGASLLPLLVLAAIFTPKLLRARIAANQASAIGSLRTYNLAEARYYVSFRSYSATLGNLGPPARGADRSADADGLVDSALSGGSTTAMVAVKDGYRFTYLPGPATARRIASYEIRADPVTPGRTGMEHYLVDQTGIIRHQPQGYAGQEKDSPR